MSKVEIAMESLCVGVCGCSAIVRAREKYEK